MKSAGKHIAAAIFGLCLAANSAQSGQPGNPGALPELREHLATHLLGRTVENQDALELGKLKDFILEADTGKPAYAVLSSAALAGLKPRRKLVPAPALSLATAKRSVLFME